MKKITYLLAFRVVTLAVTLFQPLITRAEVPVTVDLTALDDDTRRAFTASMAKASKQEFVGTEIIQKGSTLLSIINKKYGVTQPAHALDIAQSVSQINNLKSIHEIRADSPLTLPNIPPVLGDKFKSVTDNCLYTYDVQTGESTLTKVEAVTRQSTDKRCKKPSDAALVTINAPSRYWFDLLDSLPKSQNVDNLISASFVGNAGQTPFVKMEVPDYSLSNRPEAVDATCQSNKLVTNIDGLQSKVYYIIDFFRTFNKAPCSFCSHGEKVVQAARDQLDCMGLPQLKNSILKIELRFYDNPSAESELRKYAETKKGSAKSMLTAQIEQLIKTGGPPAGFDRDTTVPGLYITAILANLASDRNAAVISSSFYSKADGWDIVPFFEYRKDTTIPILSAVLNDSIDIESDDLPYQPIRSYRIYYDNRPFILVGAESAPGQWRGMFSSRAAGVTTIANGAICSKVAQGSCDFGTSFATPKIGALLLSVSEWRRQAGLQPLSGFDIRRRVVLSGAVRSEYVGRFASAGVPDMNLLLSQDGSELVSVTGRIVKPDSNVPTSEIILLEDGHKMPLHLGKGFGNTFSGFRIEGGTAYVYRDIHGFWEKLDAKDVLGVRLYGEKGAQPITMKEFSASYKGLVYF